jgi:ribosomal-protein-alanine N-acetyltransferase
VRFTIRPMRFSDLPEVAKLENDIFSDPWPVDAFEEYLDDLDGIGWAVTVQSRIVGYACCGLDEGVLHVTNLAVAPAHRRKSVAKRLMDCILTLAQERECELVYLEVRISNEAARRFYEALNFETVDRKIKYYEHPAEDALIMVRRLTAVHKDR